MAAASRGTGPTRDALVFLLVACAAFITRLPFLDAGYGAVHDAWRVAYAAYEIARTHMYVADRFPPHPIQDLVCALVSPGGAIAMNAATAVFSGIAAGVFALLVKTLAGRDYLIAGMALALTPVIFVDSTSTLDYLWGLAFILAGFYAAIRDRPLAAGVLLGLAIGCRVTSILMLLPVGLVLFAGTAVPRRVGRLLTFLVPSILIGLAAYVPGLQRYGLALVGTHGAHASPTQIFFEASTALWGSVGTLAIAGAVSALVISTAGSGIRARLGTGRPAAVALACILTIVIYGIGFLLLPAQPGYLVPIVPFALLLFAMWSNRTVFLTLCIALIVSAFIGVNLHGLQRGPIFTDHSDRLASIHVTEQILSRAEQVPHSSVLVAGHWLPILTVYLRNDHHPYPSFVWLMNASDVRRAKRARRPIYYLPGQREYNQSTYGLDLAAHGGRPLLSSISTAGITDSTSS